MVAITVGGKSPNEWKNKHFMACEAQLAWKCLFTRTFTSGQFWHKVGQTHLVFGVQWEFISRYFGVRLQVSAVVTVCATMVDLQLEFYILIPATFKSRSDRAESVGAPTSDTLMVQIWW